MNANVKKLKLPTMTLLSGVFSNWIFQMLLSILILVTQDGLDGTQTLDLQQISLQRFITTQIDQRQFEVLQPTLQTTTLGNIPVVDAHPLLRVTRFAMNLDMSINSVLH